MITVYDSQTDSQIGRMDESDLKFLIDNLEEESLEDQDYYIDTATVEFLAARGAGPELLSLLRTAIGEGDSATIVWRRS